MGSENEPAKLLLPYLQRADELQKHEPLVAYYCRLYAMERGLKIPQSDRTKTTNALLVSLMKQLEKDKKSLKLGPDDHLHVEGFALNVFTKADKQDRAGRADLNTAKTFYAASIFFEILNQFGELQPDLEQKQKYAAWKAADIRKAVKEGRKPLPGPPGGDNDLAVPSSTSAGEYDLEPSRSDFAPEPDPTRVDPSAIISPRSDSSPHQPYNQDNFQLPTNISPRSNSSPHQPYNQDNFQHTTNISPRSDSSPHQPYNQDNFQHPTNISSSSDSSSHQPYNQDNFQHPTNISPCPDSSPHQPYNQDNFQHPTNISPCPDSSPHQPYNQDNFQHPTIMLHQHSNVTPSTSPSISQMPVYPTDNYPSDNFHQPPSSNVPENSIYHQSYQQQPYQPDPEQHFPQNYPSHEVPSYSYPNFQSYPSFTETSLPTAPSHHPSYNQGSNVSLANSLPSNTAAHPSAAQYNSSPRNGIVQEASPHIAEKYEYDSNYQPPPEKIAEAHKAARFAVGALAFDDVSTAVDYLKKSLELLTNPSAGH